MPWLAVAGRAEGDEASGAPWRGLQGHLAGRMEGGTLIDGGWNCVLLDVHIVEFRSSKPQITE